MSIPLKSTIIDEANNARHTKNGPLREIICDLNEGSYDGNVEQTAVGSDSSRGLITDRRRLSLARHWPAQACNRGRPR